MLSQLLQKLKNKHFLSLAGNGIMSVLGMLTMILLYRALSVTDIGLWVFFLSTLLFVDTFRSGFITTAFIKFYAGADPKRSTEVVGSAWVIAIAITSVMILLDAVAYLFVDYISSPSILLLIKWFSVTFSVSLPTFIASCVVQGEQRFDRLLVLRLVTQGSYIVSIIFLILLGLTSLENILYAYIASAFLASLFSLVVGWARIGSIRFRTPACVHELFHFGKYSVGTTLSSNFLGTSNTFVINFMIGPEALAVYNLGQRLIELVEIPLRSFAATGMPELAAAYNLGKKEQVISTMQRYISLITMALVPVCLTGIVFADIAIEIIGGEKYLTTEAANILRILLVISLLYPLDRFLALTLDVIHQPRINFIKVIIMLVTSVIVTFLGVYATGSVYAVAVAIVIPTVIGIGIGYWGMNQYSSFGLMDIFQMSYFNSLQIVQEYRLKIQGRKN